MTSPLSGAVLCLIALVCSALPAPAAAQPAARPQLRAERAVRPPVIDGLLDDEVWERAPLETGDWLSYNPLHGDRIAQQTKVWASYDADYLYFAFKCDDPDPSGIKTSITRRDNIWQDDWVGLSLDALGSSQQAYHMMVNASGVQLDALNNAAGNEDTAPDWIWDSAGRINAEGYVVEIRLPLQSIRLAGGRNARMGILFWRRISRLGISVAWPALAPVVWVFERNASLMFDDIAPRLVRDVLPSVTYSRNQSRSSPERWSDASALRDVGVSGKVGLTSTITLDATVNPDFSQVESDAFQVQINQRFPVFFGEKRPFFMEGSGIFALSGAAATAVCGPPSTPAALSIPCLARSSPAPLAASVSAPSVPSTMRTCRAAPRSGCSTSGVRSTVSGRATTSGCSPPTRGSRAVTTGWPGSISAAASRAASGSAALR